MREMVRSAQKASILRRLVVRIEPGVILPMASPVRFEECELDAQIGVGLPIDHLRLTTLWRDLNAPHELRISRVVIDPGRFVRIGIRPLL